MKKGIICAAAALSALLAGCFKEVSDTTLYVLQPRLQASSGDQEVPLQGVRAFAYGVDTTAWAVLSYEDALAGILTSKLRPEERLTAPSAEGEAYDPAESGWLRLSLSGPVQMVVAVDPEHRLYAYTQQQLEENLPLLYVALTFKPWKKATSYKEGRWIFRNDFYAPPRQATCYIAGAVERTEGSDPAALTSVQQMKAYAFAADTATWYVASYDDAMRGRITLRADEQTVRDAPNATAYYDKQAGCFRMELQDETMMAVAVDLENGIYAYTELHPDLGGDALRYDLLFRPWRSGPGYTEQEWRYVTSQPSPEPERRGATSRPTTDSSTRQ